LDPVTVAPEARFRQDALRLPRQIGLARGQDRKKKEKDSSFTGHYRQILSDPTPVGITSAE
jgi:hypothetical protein